METFLSSKTKRKRRRQDPTVDRVWKGENECESEYVDSLETFPLE